MPAISIRELCTPNSRYIDDPARLFRALSNFNPNTLEPLLRRLPYRDFLRTPYWRAVAAQVRLTHKYRCARCNRPRSRLDVHHLSYRHHGREHLHTTTDLTALCPWCHDAKHSHPFWWHERLLKLRSSKILPEHKRLVAKIL